MIVRALDLNNDWTYGKGKSNYLKDKAAVMQNIATRLRSFLGDCFFDATAGVDWWNLLGSKNKLGLALAVRTVILNTQYVTKLVELSIELDQNRLDTMTYSAETVFSGDVVSSGPLTLLTEDGDVLVTEDGDELSA